MIDPNHFRELVIRPALARLELGSTAAENLLLGTALVESGLVYLTQHGGGPARGLYQIEPATHDDLFDTWLAFRPDWRDRLLAFVVPPWAQHDQLVWNLAYATAVARLIYYRRPEPLPDAEDLVGLAQYWKDHFNTSAGKGRAEDFVAVVDRVFPGRSAAPHDAPAQSAGAAVPVVEPVDSPLLADLFDDQILKVVELRASTSMTLGFGVADPPQWESFLEREPDESAAADFEIELSAELLEDLILANRTVNDNCPYKPDPAGNDTWRVLAPGEAGDCEDLALTKRAMMTTENWPAGGLRPAICRTDAGERHMVLLIFTTAGVYVADNRFDHIAPWKGLPYKWESVLCSTGWRLIIEGSTE